MLAKESLLIVAVFEICAASVRHLFDFHGEVAAARNECVGVARLMPPVAASTQQSFCGFGRRTLKLRGQQLSRRHDPLAARGAVDANKGRISFQKRKIKHSAIDFAKSKKDETCGYVVRHEILIT